VNNFAGGETSFAAGYHLPQFSGLAFAGESIESFVDG
jgi:hypothetical protein